MEPIKVTENVQNERMVISLNTPSDLVRIKRIKKKLYELKFVHNGVLHVIKENIARHDIENNLIVFDVANNRNEFILLHKQGVGYFTCDAYPMPREEAEAVINALAHCPEIQEENMADKHTSTNEEIKEMLTNPEVEVVNLNVEKVEQTTTATTETKTEEVTEASEVKPEAQPVVETPVIESKKKDSVLSTVAKTGFKVGFVAATGWLVYRTIKFLAEEEV